jgi:sulfonate transport system substrate-binding protein
MLVAAAFGLAAAGLGSPALAAEKVRLTFTEGSAAVVVLAATEKGFLKAEGLEYELKPMRAGVEGIESVTQGVMDFGLVHIAPIIATAARKLPLKVVAVNNSGTQLVVVVPPADKATKSMRDLKGKRIALQRGTGTHAVWLRYIEHEGLSERDFKMKYIRNADIASALAGGEVDAGVPWYPFALSIVNKGLGRMVLSNDDIAKPLNDKYTFTLFTRAQLVKEKPQLVQKVVNAWVKAQRWITDNPEGAAQLYHAFTTRRGQTLEMKDAKFLMGTMRFDKAVFGQEFVDDMMNNARIMKKMGWIKEIPDPKAVVETSFAIKASQAK